MEKGRENFLEAIVNAISPSGFEEEAVRVWADRAKKYADRVYTDYHGNAIAVLNERKEPRVMLAGHIDEIGYMITYVDENGYLYFSTIGGVDPQIAQGQRIWIKGKDGSRILGVIGKKAIHLLDEEERKRVPKFKDMWIDIGANNRDEVFEKIEIGTCAVNAQIYERLFNGNVVARGFDDRVGSFIALESLIELSKIKGELSTSVYAVATVQEEVGLRGARTSAFAIDPHIGIAVDVTHTADQPGVEKKVIGDLKLGSGPIIARGPNISPKVFEKLVQTAKELNIPYQIEPEPYATGTDANVIQLTRSGVATGLVSVPNRYMHTPCEVVNLSDLDNIINLLASFVQRIKSKDEFILYNL
ncbi:MAG TPA: M42 family metallopeptidase [Candidatus Hydrothermia bacterium]|nr:M42 family metallopeptidase [Candidatus Hydrothermia bacterium]HOK22452.1 M42 family metallopeptidase [Candidatus Hydrothermia bacterium]HOL23159.1 M42 family metallopeptidase [Candidatus Hydrothermia bacterium]HPO78169.1 M42 family metallopeptidase [Candidatus Hydrothermia bacterium]